MSVDPKVQKEGAVIELRESSDKSGLSIRYVASVEGSLGRELAEYPG